MSTQTRHADADSTLRTVHVLDPIVHVCYKNVRDDAAAQWSNASMNTNENPTPHKTHHFSRGKHTIELINGVLRRHRLHASKHSLQQKEKKKKYNMGSRVGIKGNRKKKRSQNTHVRVYNSMCASLAVLEAIARISKISVKPKLQGGTI